jgi:hypothetical protein
MSAFPALPPVGRSYSFGRFPLTRQSGLGGNQIKFLHSQDKSGVAMTLTYENLTQTEMANIRDHYRGRQGTFLCFLLPDDIWAGHSSVSNIVPVGTTWRYVSPPEETQKTAGYVDVTVSLVTEATVEQDSTSHTTLPSGEVPRTGVGLNPGGTTFCGGAPASIKWYKNGVLLSTTVGGVVTYESGAERPSWLGLLGEGVLLIKAGDEGSTYTSLVTCSDGRSEGSASLVQPGILTRNYSYRFTNPTSFVNGSYVSYGYPPYLGIAAGSPAVYVYNPVFGGYFAGAQGPNISDLEVNPLDAGADPFLVTATLAAGAATSVEPDPDFANVSLLLPMDGTDGSTTFTDESNSPFTVTAFGNAQIDTAFSQFGGASLLLDGTGDYATITSPPVSLREWWSDTYQIDMWVRVGAFTEKDTGLNKSSVLVGNMDTGSDTNYWSFGPRVDGKIVFYYFNGSQNVIVSSSSLSLNTQTNIRMSHSSGTVRVFIGGTLDVSASVSGTPMASSSTPFTIGSLDSIFYNGHVDDLRIQRGGTVTTASYTPRTSAWPTS